MILDYMIVGQGTSGTMISYFLEKAGASYIVIDDGHQSSSSLVAAGIVNPITGKRYVKSWRIDEFLPFARKTYQELEKEINTTVLIDRNIVRALNDEGQENDWFAQTASAGYEQYFTKEVITSEFEGKVNKVFAYGEICKSFQVKLFDLIPKYKELLISREQYYEDIFIHNELEIAPDYITYKGIKAKKIIFAEGYRSIHNPYFNTLPFAPVKGEILLVKIPNANFRKMLKHQIFIVPTYDDIYWVGSNYEWNFIDTKPSKENIVPIKEALAATLSIPYEIIDHKSGIRPSFKNRRPIILHHPKYDNLILFNGLGAKGTSLAPFWANHLVSHLENGTDLDNEVKAIKYIDLLKI